MDPELLPGSGTRKIQNWIRNKSFLYYFTAVGAELFHKILPTPLHNLTRSQTKSTPQILRMHLMIPELSMPAKCKLLPVRSANFNCFVKPLTRFGSCSTSETKRLHLDPAKYYWYGSGTGIAPHWWKYYLWRILERHSYWYLPMAMHNPGFHCWRRAYHLIQGDAKCPRVGCRFGPLVIQVACHHVLSGRSTLDLVACTIEAVDFNRSTIQCCGSGSAWIRNFCLDPNTEL